MSADKYPAVRYLSQHPSDAELDQIVTFTSKAFEGDPLTDLFSGKDHSLIPHQLRASIKAAAISGQVHVATIGPNMEDIVGAALWYPPGTSPMSTEEVREESGWNALLAMLPEDLKKWWITYLGQMTHQLSEKAMGAGYSHNAWHLAILAVSPEYQGKGYGKLLFKHVDDLAIKEGKSIILQTATDVDIKIYQHLGCELRGETLVESSIRNEKVYLLVKENRRNI